MSRPPIDERSYCDVDDPDEHDWRLVEIVATPEELEYARQTYHTRIEDCANCDARRWLREQHTATLDEF